MIIWLKKVKDKDMPENYFFYLTYIFENKTNNILIWIDVQRNIYHNTCRSNWIKIVCCIDELEPGCVVYSIGGNKQWPF